MSRPLWTISLNSIRRRLEAGANRYSDLGCLLIHWGENDIPFELREHYPGKWFRGELRRVGRGTGGYCVRKVTHSAIVSREHFYLSSYLAGQRGASVFERAAREAVRCLHEVPGDVLSRFTIPSWTAAAESTAGESRWVWLHFDISSSQPVESPRHVRRSIWTFADGESPDIPESILCFPHDSSWIKQSIASPKSRDDRDLQILRRWAKRLPARYFAYIPDVFSWSIWILDRLLAAGETVVIGGTAPDDTITDSTATSVGPVATATYYTPNEDRDKWIYEECCKGTAYDTIIELLEKQAQFWERIGSPPGIRASALRYAKRHSLPLPKRRQSAWTRARAPNGR